jgi:hypothetical protein
METLAIKSITELEERVSDITSELRSNRPHDLVSVSIPLFRGHASSKWPIKTTLERYETKKNDSVEGYNRFLARVKPAVEAFTEKDWEFIHQPELPEDFFRGAPPNYEFMIYARHHGFPSPLLDWSRSPYVALYFAFQNASSDGAVAIYQYVAALKGMKSGQSGAATITELGPYATTHKRHFMQQARYTICTEFKDEKWCYVSHNPVFDSGEEEQDLLVQYTMLGSDRTEVLKKLDQMNINAYTLFGTEDALMHTLAFRESFGRDI